MNRELIITELRQLESELQQDLTDIQSAIKVLTRIEPQTRIEPPAVQIAVSQTVHKYVVEKTCVFCGKKFMPTSNVQKTCSPECREGYKAKKKSDLKETTSVRKLKKSPPITFMGTKDENGNQMELTPQTQDQMNKFA